MAVDEIPDNEEKRLSLQATATQGNLAMLVLRKAEGESVKYPIGPVAAKQLLQEVTVHERMSGRSTIPIAAVERAGLDMETWGRAVQSGLIKQVEYNGVPVFALVKAEHISGAGLIEHEFLDRLGHIAQQDPDKWQEAVRASMAEARKMRGV